MKRERKTVTCEFCARSFPARLITVVNRSEASDRAVTPDEVFTLHCPHCGKTNTVGHFAVWYDDVSGVAVCCLTCEEERRTLEQTVSALQKRRPGLSVARRYVTSPARFCEKITILSAGWDDRMIEIVKCWLTAQFAAQYPARVIRDVLFYRDGEQYGFWFVCADGTFAVPVSKEQLDRAAEEFCFAGPAPETVDAEWVLRWQKERELC